MKLLSWQPTIPTSSVLEGIVLGLRHVFLLLVRVYWGWGFFNAGRGKLLNLEPTSRSFEGWGIPIPTISAAVAGSCEAIFGLAMVLGLFARLATLPLIVVMLVAYLTAHATEVVSPAHFVAAAPFTFLMACLIVLIFGPGAISVDAALARWRRPRPITPQDAPARAPYPRVEGARE